MARHGRLGALLASALIVGAFTAIPAEASAKVLFILDGSGSMWERVDGEPKIATAKKVLGQVLQDLPADAEMGLMSYGLNRKGDCSDIDLLSPIGPNNAATIAKQVSGISPKGDTPIAAALTQSADAFKGVAGQKMIVLVTDGAEECNGDPCAAAKALAAADVDLHVNIVGFNLKDKQRNDVQCIAEQGRGEYFDAKDIAGLTTAMNRVATEVKVADAAPAAAPPPPPAAPAAPVAPAAPTSKVVFSDNFQGSALGPDWTVLNPSPDNYAVDGGKLLIVTSTAGGHTEPTLPNIMQYNKPMPDGNWKVTVELAGDMQTAQEHFEIGLRDDDKNFLGSSFRLQHGGDDVQNYIEVEKISNGAPVSQALMVKDLGYANDVTKLMAPLEPITLTLTKTGRSYRAAMAYNGDLDKDGKQIWYSPAEVTSLKPPKSLVLAGSQLSQVTGESTFEIQSVTIEQTGP